MQKKWQTSLSQDLPFTNLLIPLTPEGGTNLLIC